MSLAVLLPVRYMRNRRLPRRPTQRLHFVVAESTRVRPSTDSLVHRAALTLIELLVVLAIVGVLTALLFPVVQQTRESSRRTACGNRLRQIALGLHSYHDANSRMPPPAIVASSPGLVTICGSGTGYLAQDVIGEAGRGAGFHGTSWMLRVLPYVEQSNLYNQWNFTTSVRGNQQAAEANVPLYYCPSRRKTVINRGIMFGGWGSGGNDYGGCIGACNGWHNCGAHESWTVADGRRATGPCKGIFSLQRSTRFADATDGLTNTIMIGELQRLDLGKDVTTSRDGWAVGGVSTHFSTCSDGCGGPNSKHFEEPGSSHPNGAQFAMADGSVRFLATTVPRTVFSALGSMGQGDIGTEP
jgi:prepilin-type N-terminal cleavage/methylation domain-containing protein/prepilin-type processing-associated H-X9-DG protein